MNVKLGTPYEVIIKKLIEKGYAGNQTEVIRQALLNYDREIEEEEVILVNRGIGVEMEEFKKGKTKAYSLAEVKRELRK